MTRRLAAAAWAILPTLLACSGGSSPQGDEDADADATREARPTDVPDAPDARTDADADGAGDGGPSEDGADRPERDTSRSEDAVEVESPEVIELPPVCGDGRVDPGEACDDGNRLDGDGCDWQCRLGAGSFEYPPPDPSVPPIEPTTPPTPATGDDEMSSWAPAGRSGEACRGIWLRAGGGRFALAYNYTQPYYGVRLRVLDRTGVSIAEPWSRETPWGALAHGLAWNGAGFALFSGSPYEGMFLSRFDADGVVLDEFRRVRDPDPTIGDPEGSHWYLSDAAWARDRYLAVGGVSHSDARWGLETYGPDGAALDARRATGAFGGSDCLEADVTVDGSLAVTDGNALVVFDPDLRVVGWSGRLRGEMWDAAAVAIAPDGVWMAWLQSAPSPGWPGMFTLWVAAFGLDGEPRFPPRRLSEPFFRAWTDSGTLPSGMCSPVAIGHGPAGAAIAWWEGRGEALPDGWVKLLTVDEWGNVRTPPTSVLGDDVVTPLGWVLDVAGDDEGYAVVTATEGPVLGTAVLVFRHYAASP